MFLNKSPDDTVIKAQSTSYNQDKTRQKNYFSLCVKKAFLN